MYSKGLTREMLSEERRFSNKDILDATILNMNLNNGDYFTAVYMLEKLSEGKDISKYIEILQNAWKEIKELDEKENL